MDISVNEPTLTTSFIAVFFYCIGISSNIGFLRNPLLFSLNVSGINKIKLLFLGLLLSLLCIDGDFFHMISVIQNYSFNGGYNYGEPVYGDIAYFVDRNYILFRIVVWGSAFSFFLLTAKRFDISIYQAGVYLFMAFSYIFCYARVSLGMALFYYGISFFLKPSNNKIIGYFFGTIMIYFSNMFHSSIVVLIAMSAIVFVPINKKILFVCLLLSPIILSLLQDLFLTIASNADEMENTGQASRISRYSQEENTGTIINFSNPGVAFHTLLMYCSFYIPLFNIIKTMFKTRLIKDPLWSSKICKLCIAIVYLSSIFIFMSIGSRVLFYRILFMSMFPICLLVLYLYNNGYFSKQEFRLCLYSGIAFNFVRIVYGFYGQLIK